MKPTARALALLFCLGATLAPSGLLARQFNAVETDNMRLVYIGKAYEYIIPHAVACFENAYQFHQRLFDYRSKEKITVFMEDFGDFANGGAGPIPHNFVSVGLSPFRYVYETMTANDRINLIMNHELAHVATMDRPAASDRFYRTLFAGKVAPDAANPLSMLYSTLTNPRVFTPSWFVEGSAVFMETWMGGGMGRAQSWYDEMVFRTKVKEGAFFYDVIGLESEGTKVDFQVGANSYLYGTRVMSYLAYTYGPEKLMDWVRRGEGSRRGFLSQFKKIFGLSLDKAWSDWIAWEHKWQRANLDSLRAYPITPHRRLLAKALGSVSRAYLDSENNRIFLALRYPGQVAHIASIDMTTGKLRKICNVPGAALFFVTSLAHDPATETLFYTTNNGKWRDLARVHIPTGRTEKLIEDARTGDLAFNTADSSLWGVRHYLGISTLVRIPPPYTEVNQVVSWPYGQDLYDIDISPDGTRLTGALAEVDGSHRLIEMRIDPMPQEHSDFETIFDFENSTPANFVFSPDGRFLYGSSYYSGVSNIFRYTFATREMDIVSNSETGFFRPLPLSQDSLLVMNYAANGFVPGIIPLQNDVSAAAINLLGNAVIEKHPQLQKWMLPPPSVINPDSVQTGAGTYAILGNLKFRSFYPIVEGYKDGAAVGLKLNFLDDIALAKLDISGSWSPDSDLPADERFHAAFDFRYWRWTIKGNYNGANFYDLFGPTKKSRRGYSLGINYDRSLLHTGDTSIDFSTGVSGYGNLERLPRFQNVAASFDKLLSFHADLNYKAIRKSLGAVDEEAGAKWGLALYSNYVNSELFPQLHADAAYGFQLPINHSSIWFRTSAGIAGGNRNNPFSNFYFGGFGNNWVDHQDEKRYRESYSFPGVELNAVGGRNYGKAMLEWTLPPLRFRRLGSMLAYATWLRPALFASGIVTNIDNDAARRRLVNAGAQLDLELVLFARLASTFSVGFAIAGEEGRAPATEWMFSLKIM